MIYITGDTHGDYTRIKDEKLSQLSKGDFLIICGDFGYIFSSDLKGIYKENKQLDKMEKLPFTILFIPGNHENFNRLKSFEHVKMFDETVRKIRNNIFMLESGRVYTIEGKTFFCMGGASSIDKYLRTPNVSWWTQELPSKDEYDRANDSLKRYDYKFDYILTHTAPIEIIKILGFNPYLGEDLELTSYLSYVLEKCKFKLWFFGHFHENRIINYSKTNFFDISRKDGNITAEEKTFSALFDEIIKIEEDKTI